MTLEATGPAAISPARVESHVVGPRGLTLRLDRGLLALEPRSARTLRVRYTLGRSFSDEPSLMVVDEEPAVVVPFDVQAGEHDLVLSTEALSVKIGRDGAALTYHDRDGRLLVREPAGGGKSLQPIDVEVSVFDGATAVESDATVDGLHMDTVDVRTVVDRQAYQATLRLTPADDEALYGLGSHEEGLFNLRGQQQYLYQHNLKVAVPVLVSSRGVGVLVDCASLMRFEDGDAGASLWCDVVDELDYYVMVGPELDEVVAELRELTGRAAMLPRWALGYIQSKERYETAAELVDVAREFRRRDLPLDGIVLDWKSWTGDLWGQKSLDPERFPDPAGLMAELHALHAHLMVSVWPVMRAGGDDWTELSEAGYLLGDRATYDAFDTDARACFWRQSERGLFRHGVDAWWTDSTEPFEDDWRGPVKPDAEERMWRNTAAAKRYLDPGRINAYSLLHAQGIYEGQRGTGSDKRVLNLTRSAYPGQQRFGTVTWSGDVTASWETLRRQVPEGLNFCSTGMPYWTTDIGAFFVAHRPENWFWAGDFDAGVDDLGYRELYLRWFQYGAWLPMFRAHGTDTPRELWRFGEPGDAMYDALVAALRLRYRLLPYLYSLAGWTTQRHYTMLRSLVFDFREDPLVLDIGDQFMCGPAFLVAPVYEPMCWGPGSTPLHGTSGERPVYLPAGSGWYALDSDRQLTGGQWIDAAAPLAHIPVFVRAGSIVPMGPVRQYVDELPEAPLEIHVYPGRDVTFTLYEDEGDGHAWEGGAFSTIELAWNDAARCLSVGPRAGRYRGMPEERELMVVVHGQPAGDRREPAAAAGPAIRRLHYTGEAVELVCP